VGERAICFLSGLAGLRCLNLFSGSTQDFRPGLLSIAPSGLEFWWF
jgi:hypothetical protein